MKSFKTKLMLIIVIIMVIPLAIFGYITIKGNMEDSRGMILETNGSLAENLAGEVEKTIVKSEEIIQILSTSDVVEGMNPAAMEDLLQEAVKTDEFIAGIQVINKIGREIYTTTGEPEDCSAETYFQRAAAGETYYSDVLTSNRFDFPIVEFAVPIRSEGEITGVMAATLNLKVLSNLAADSEVGNTGYGFIVDSRGRVIGHPDEGMVRNMTDISDLAPVSKVIKGQRGNEEYTSQGE